MVFTPAEARQVLSGMRGDVSWLPDGRLIFQMAETGSVNALEDTCNFWTMQFDPHTGKPTEEPKRLANWTGFCISKANVTADGKRLAFLASSGHLTAYVADLEAGGKRVVNPRHFVRDEGDNVIADWTPDGGTVIVDHNQGDQYSLYKQPLGAETPDPIVAPTPGALVWALVSPDGQWVITVVAPIPRRPTEPKQVMRVPITGGTPQLMFQVRGGSSISCARPPSSLCGVAEQSEDGKQMIVTALDAVKGRGSELARFNLDPDFNPQISILVWSISPDGTRLAAARGLAGPIEIRSLTGQPTQVIQARDLTHIRFLIWAADGKGLFVTNKTKDGADILHLDLTGNTDLIWRSVGERGTYGSQSNVFPSPDGRHLAIKDFQQTANMWMMEDF
jgi:dipeptidyl aminopeptidase/acylaminoacyl peptidase